MKPICFSFFLLFMFTAGLKAQNTGDISSKDSVMMLLADNGRHNRLYGNMRTLKIHYQFDGQIIKAKGRLFIKSDGSIQLKPFRHNDIVVIPVDSIESIASWHRKGKGSLAFVGGAELFGIGLTSVFYHRLPSGAFAIFDINPGELVGIIITFYSFCYLVIATPAVLLAEWLSVRSRKKGYHFSVQNIILQKGFWGEPIIPKKLPEPKYSR